MTGSVGSGGGPSGGTSSTPVPARAPITTRYDIESVVKLLEELEKLKNTYRAMAFCGAEPVLDTVRDGFVKAEDDAHHYVDLPRWVIQPIRQLIADRISTIDQMLINDWGLVNHVTYGWS